MPNQEYELEIFQNNHHFKGDGGLFLYYNYVSVGLPSVPYRWHPEYEILYCLSGTVEISLPSGMVRLDKNDCYLIDSNVIHATKCSPDSSLIILAVPLHFVHFYLKDSENFYFDLHHKTCDAVLLDALSALKELILEYKKIIDAHEDYYPLLLNSIALHLLFLLNKYFKIQRPESIARAAEKNKKTVLRVVQYVYDNYTRNISIAEISELAHYQPQYFCRFFKKYTGKTFQDFCNQVRMYYAHQEILHSDKAIYEISEGNGFQNYETFRKLFIRQFGMAPRKFRKIHKIQPKNTHA